MMRVADIRSLADLCKTASKTAETLLCVDGTMMSPWLQRPLELGADIVMHSATKLLSGHADTTAGALLTNDKDLTQRIRFLQNAQGNALAPFDAFLLTRGMKTLSVRSSKSTISFPNPMLFVA